MNSPAGLTDADVTRILHLIDNLHDVEVRVEVEGMKLHVRKFAPGTAATVPVPTSPGVQAPQGNTERVASQSPTTVPAAQGSAAKGEPDAVAIPQDVVTIRAPMLGRFFRAPSPTEPPYVDVGSTVEPDDTVCMIEVMKLFNTVRAGVRGTIVGVASQNGDMVEYDSVLFLVKPS